MSKSLRKESLRVAKTRILLVDPKPKGRQAGRQAGRPHKTDTPSVDQVPRGLIDCKPDWRASKRSDSGWLDYKASRPAEQLSRKLQAEVPVQSW